MLKLVKMDVNDILTSEKILDYIAIKRSDYYDRFMDCATSSHGYTVDQNL